MKIWEPKAPGTLWATPGLLWDSLPFFIKPLLGILPVPLQCEPRAVSRASLAVVLTALRPGQGTNPHTHYVSSTVTRLVIYPVLGMTGHFCCKLHAVTFTVGAWSAAAAPQYDNRATRNPATLGVRPQTYPAIPTHHSARARGTTELHAKFRY